MSGLPVATITVPSSLTCTDALDSPPPMNQKPEATPHRHIAGLGIDLDSQNWVEKLGPSRRH
jgi:hypothetical protein